MDFTIFSTKVCEKSAYIFQFMWITQSVTAQKDIVKLIKIHLMNLTYGGNMTAAHQTNP